MSTKFRNPRYFGGLEPVREPRGEATGSTETCGLALAG
jgi:hypothetical protein